MSVEQSKILIVEDEDRIRRLLRMYLEREGCIIDEAEDGREALKKIEKESYNLIILDIMLPEVDGWTVCQSVRKTKDTPVLILTAYGEEVDRILGLELGADDYVTKPFSPREVVLRVKALLRRSLLVTQGPNSQYDGDIIDLPGLRLDKNTRKVMVNQQEVIMTPKEFDLLFFLASSPGIVYSREQLLSKVWQYDFFGGVRTVDAHVKRLRKKLADISPEISDYISTVWGVGYKFEVA